MNKRILFSVFCKSQLHINIVKVLIEMFQAKGNSIDIKSNQDKIIFCNDNLQVQLFKETLHLEYDIIIAFNLKGYNYIKAYQKENNIPLIYALCNSDIENEYLLEHNLIDRILLINDDRNFYPTFFPFEYTTSITFPFKFINNNIVSSINESNILVYSDNATLLKIIPVLNNHGEFKFTIISETPNRIKKLVNGHILVANINKIKLDEHIQNALFVIGSGEFILRSLQFEKPSIVVGKYGYGRLVSNENINQHFGSNFLGRIGGQAVESIPFNLLSFEIVRLMNNIESIKNDSKQLRIILHEQYNLTANIVDRLINATISKPNIWNRKLKLCSIYWFIEINHKSYVIVDSRMFKIQDLITVDEYHIINQFKKASTPRSVLKKSGNKDKDKFLMFIERMRTNKTLLFYEE